MAFAAAALVLGAEVIGRTASQRPAHDPAEVHRAADRYLAGDDAAAAELARSPVTVGQLVSALDTWISHDVSPQPRRLLAAVALAIDACWVAHVAQADAWPRLNLDPHGRVEPRDPQRVRLGTPLAPDLAGRWVAARLTKTLPLTAAHRAAWHAGIGLMHRGSAWTAVLDVLPGAEQQLASERRVSLWRALATTSRRLGSLRLSGGVRIDLLRDERLGTAVTRHIPGALREFERLIDVSELRAEAHLRMAYLEIRRRNWRPALDHLAKARESPEDPFLPLAADYFEGWVREMLQEPDAAVAAYARTHERAPTMRNPAISLAALLFERSDRPRAYAVLERAFGTDTPAEEALLTLEHGDARFVSRWLSVLREGLR